MVKENVSYPMISTSAWWAIRKKFNQSLPTRPVTDTFLAGLLSMEVQSAKNLIGPLKKMGLIDNDSKPTERAARWRNDEQYASVCEEIRNEIYPAELLDLFPGPDSPRQSIENWFTRSANIGAEARKKMTTVYLLLAEADLTKQDGTSSKTLKATKGSPVTLKVNAPKGKTEKTDKAIAIDDAPNSTQVKPNAVERNTHNIGPALHIDIQIHIASDASPDQIDQIFASMAKHLYKNSDSNK